MHLGDLLLDLIGALLASYVVILFILFILVYRDKKNIYLALRIVNSDFIYIKEEVKLWQISVRKFAELIKFIMLFCIGVYVVMVLVFMTIKGF